jgi:8-oxo-dGTP pyrophosphatase MutT (NUDIX family)
MLDLSFDRKGVTPKDAATLLLLKDTADGPAIFCVERNKKSRFLGGALVFPGGKLDPADGDAAWGDLCEETLDQEPRAGFASDAAHLRALRIAACRETLEEAAILPVNDGALGDEAVLALRAKVEGGADLRAELRALGIKLRLSRVVPFSRWVTPSAEARRYDARFFVCKAPAGQSGAHDQHETMASFWATPKEILERFSRREVELAPPTHRTLEILSGFSSVDALIAWTETTTLAPICPELKPQKDHKGETLALVLPGDPEHELKEARAPGKSRYVLRDGQWLAEDAPR